MASQVPAGALAWMERAVDLGDMGLPGARERITLAASLGTSRALSLCSPTSTQRQAWRELSRTIEAFRLFRLGRRCVPRKSRAESLASQIKGLHRGHPFRGLWATEGLGHERAEEHPPSPALLGDSVTQSLPIGSLVPLHAGVGLALAQERLIPDSHGETLEIRPVLSDLVHAIEQSTTSGCHELAIEGIGLFVRTLLRSQLDAFDAAFASDFPHYRNLFWHGVGRTFYFLFPRALSRGPSWSGWAQTRLEPPDSTSRRSAQVGFVWALSLVNIDESDVIASFLLHHGDGLDEDAFREGMVGSALAWHAWAGLDQRLRALLEHRSPERERLRWRERVSEPVREALARLAIELEANRCLGTLYPGAD